MFLSEFEQHLEDEVVQGVYVLTMEAVASASQVLALKPVKTSKIETPMKLKEEKNEKGKHKADMSDIDSCEDLGDEELPSDLEADGPPAVDTDSDKQSFDTWQRHHVSTMDIMIIAIMTPAEAAACD